MSKKITCQECNGSGISPDFTEPYDNKACQACGGSGSREVDDTVEERVN